MARWDSALLLALARARSDARKKPFAMRTSDQAPRQEVDKMFAAAVGRSGRREGQRRCGRFFSAPRAPPSLPPCCSDQRTRCTCELARITGVSPATLRRELRALSELGLLTRREVGRQVFYSANRASAMFPELAGLRRKTAGLADLLRGALAPLHSEMPPARVCRLHRFSAATSHARIGAGGLARTGQMPWCSQSNRVRRAT